MKSAADLYRSVEKIYKKDDYRCLKPYSHKDPKKWHTYDMHAYRRAFDDKTLQNVDSFKYDNDFNNWIDPSVFDKYTSDIETIRNVWNKSYGFNNTFLTAVMKSETDWNFGTDCLEKCAQLVKFQESNIEPEVLGATRPSF